MEPTLNISLSPEILFHIGSFPVTNSYIWTVFLTVFLFVFLLVINKKKKEVPGRIQLLTEMIFEGAYNFVVTVVGNEKKAKKIFPLVFTMFLFTALANLLTYLPASSLTLKHSGVPLFRAIMADYGFVFVMTLITVITCQVVAIAVNGPFGYFLKYFNFRGIAEFFRLLLKGKFKIGVLAQGCLDFFLGLMDIIGELAKVISLSFRLFGNMFAGEVLGAVILFLVPFFAPLPFLFLGLLTTIVQAFVFSILTLIFITMASETGEVEEPQKVEAIKIN